MISVGKYVLFSKCCKMCILESVGKYKIGYKCGKLWIKFYM